VGPSRTWEIFKKNPEETEGGIYVISNQTKRRKTVNREGGEHGWTDSEKAT